MEFVGLVVTIVGAALSALAFWQAGRAKSAANQAAVRISGRLTAAQLDRLPLIHLGLETWVLRQDGTGVRWSIHQWVDAAGELVALVSDRATGHSNDRYLQLDTSLRETLTRVPTAYAAIEAGEPLVDATRSLRAEMLLSAIAATTLATSMRVELVAEDH